MVRGASGVGCPVSRSRASALENVANSLPLSKSESLSTFWVDGYADKKDQLAQSRFVTPQYLSAMSIPLIAGRSFIDADNSSTANTVIVNQSFARIYFANRNPIGGRISQDEHHSQ